MSRWSPEGGNGVIDGISCGEALARAKVSKLAVRLSAPEPRRDPEYAGKGRSSGLAKTWAASALQCDIAIGVASPSCHSGCCTAPS